MTQRSIKPKAMKKNKPIKPTQALGRIGASSGKPRGRSQQSKMPVSRLTRQPAQLGERSGPGMGRFGTNSAGAMPGQSRKASKRPGVSCRREAESRAISMAIFEVPNRMRIWKFNQVGGLNQGRKNQKPARPIRRMDQASKRRRAA